ncbi:unnamed protein product [Musa acuminata subsp. burmannicoides]
MMPKEALLTLGRTDGGVHTGGSDRSRLRWRCQERDCRRWWQRGCSGAVGWRSSVHGDRCHLSVDSVTPERRTSGANIRAHQQRAVEVQVPPPAVVHCDHGIRLVRGNQSPRGETPQVVEQQQGGDRMPAQERHHLVLGDEDLGQHPVAGHQEGGVVGELVLHHLDEHGEGEVAGALHLPDRHYDVPAVRRSCNRVVGRCRGEQGEQSDGEKARIDYRETSHLRAAPTTTKLMGWALPFDLVPSQVLQEGEVLLGTAPSTSFLFFPSTWLLRFLLGEAEVASPSSTSTSSVTDLRRRVLDATPPASSLGPFSCSAAILSNSSPSLLTLFLLPSPDLLGEEETLNSLFPCSDASTSSSSSPPDETESGDARWRGFRPATLGFEIIDLGLTESTGVPRCIFSCCARSFLMEPSMRPWRRWRLKLRPPMDQCASFAQERKGSMTGTGGSTRSSLNFTSA